MTELKIYKVGQTTILKILFPLKSHRTKHSLRQIYDQFVFAPTDKPYGNIEFIWKRFYLEVILKEPGKSSDEQMKVTET